MNNRIQDYIDFASIIAIIVFMLFFICVGKYFWMIGIRNSQLYICTTFESAELRDQCRTRIVNGEALKNDR